MWQIYLVPGPTCKRPHTNFRTSDARKKSTASRLVQTVSRSGGLLGEEAMAAVARAWSQSSDGARTSNRVSAFVHDTLHIVSKQQYCCSCTCNKLYFLLYLSCGWHEPGATGPLKAETYVPAGDMRQSLMLRGVRLWAHSTRAMLGARQELAHSSGARFFFGCKQPNGYTDHPRWDLS